MPFCYQPVQVCIGNQGQAMVLPSKPLAVKPILQDSKLMDLTNTAAVLQYFHNTEILQYLYQQGTDRVQISLWFAVSLRTGKNISG